VKEIAIEYTNHDHYLNWIFEGRDLNAGANRIRGLLPDLFDCYFKLYFPLGLLDEKMNQYFPINYRDLADLNGLQFDENFSFTNIVKEFEGWPGNLKVMNDLGGTFINSLTKLIGEKEDCVFYGGGDDIVPEEFEREWHVTGKVENFHSLFSHLNKEAFRQFPDFPYFPNYCFALNKKWCLGERIVQSGILVLGCDEDLAKVIRSQKEIEYVELEEGDTYFEYLKN